VAFVAGRRCQLLQEKKMLGGPDIAVEVVSRDSRTRDYVEKKQLYQEAGIPEYWILDPVQQRAEFYRLGEARYVLVPLEHNRIFRSEAMEGFWLDVEWLFVEPLPAAYEKFQEIIKV
jgi:Uma2 family endonuclease